MLKKMLCVMISGLLAGLFVLPAQADEPSVALDCEAKAGSSVEHRALILYKTKNQEGYTKGCLDTLGSLALEPLRCFEPVFTNAKYISDSKGNFKVNRKTLEMILNPKWANANASPSREYSCNDYGELKEGSLSCAHFRCELSPNAGGTVMAIKKLKSKELSSNRI
jgi:hypothetical protein